MIANPIEYSYSKESFSYEGGKHLYHFSPSDCGMNQPNIGVGNMCLFADSEEHALDVLKRMFQFNLNLLLDLKVEYGKTSFSNKHYFAHDRALKYYQSWLDNFDKAKVILVPTNTIMKVSFASNDYLV